jgi:hypothetical protein
LKEYQPAFNGTCASPWIKSLEILRGKSGTHIILKALQPKTKPITRCIIEEVWMQVIHQNHSHMSHNCVGVLTAMQNYKFLNFIAVITKLGIIKPFLN